MLPKYYTSEIYHYGIKGMRWGVRRFQNDDGSLTNAGKKRQTMLEARDKKAVANTRYKMANRAYSKSFDYAYNRAHDAYSPSKSRRLANDERWKDVETKAEQLRSAKGEYKKTKNDYKEAKADYKEQKARDRFEKHGLDYNLDTYANVHNYGWAGAKRIEDRVANTKMSRLKAEVIEGGRQAATIALTTAGTLAVAGLAVKYANPSAQVLDAAGKVIKNIY